MTADFRPATQGSEVPIPALLPGDPRVRQLSVGASGHQGRFVLYWPQMARRAWDNAALSLAIAEANRRRLPLAVYEALRVDYPHASDRLHAFVLEGARGEAARYRERGAEYAFFLPRSPAEARGVLGRLSQQAALIVTDDHPSFVVPGHLGGAAKASACPLWVVEDNAVVPVRLIEGEQYMARTLRPRLARLLDAWLRPLEHNACDHGPARVDWPFAPLDLARLDLPRTLAGLPIDHGVPPVAATPGGSAAAGQRLDRFLRTSLARYPDDHSHPDEQITSGLSPYLHFGMIGAREVALAARAAGAPEAARNAFLEQLLVRRGLAFNLAYHNPRHATLDALPSWAREGLRSRESDRRAQIYSRAELEAARTGDAVWNAAQRELLATGVIQNYLRMLWGKCVIAWKNTADEAFADLLYLNDKLALDGRDPNTYASILWCFGKHDRPWGPARPAFGSVRYMSTDAAQKKLRMRAYLARWSRPV
jgi:deoxyribodipyrimidine photo-lyase